MPDLFSPSTLKGVTLRNRTVMSPMTMYNSVDGKLDAVRAVWPEKYPLTMRPGSDDLNPAGTQFDDAVVAAGMQNADRVVREQLIDLVMLGRPALANPHWPVWAARELGHASPFSLVQQDWRWWLERLPWVDNGTKVSVRRLRASISPAIGGRFSRLDC